MEYGSIKNAAGNFVKADVTTVTDAAAGAAKELPADFRVSITNAPGKNAYPISTFTWLLIPDTISDATKKKAIKDFLAWMMTAAQADAPALSYAPLPKPIVAKEQKQIALIK
jgi:phosphate transport system substrate-binding protein